MADRRLQVFHAVATQRSFTKAAELLFMTQPAVTFQIKQLEEQFNTRLFDRGHQRITLTAAGEVVFTYAERILTLNSELDARVADMTDDIAGSLCIGASTTVAEFYLPKLVGKFTVLHPHVRPRMMVGNSESIERAVAERVLDIGFVESHTHDPKLEVMPWQEDELMVICSPLCPFAKLKAITPKKLFDQPFISREPGSGTRQFTNAYLRDAGLEPEKLNYLLEMGSAVAVNGALEAGTGFSIASRATVARAQRLGTLVTIPLNPRLTRMLSIVFAKEKFQSRLVSAFVAFSLDGVAS